MGSGHAQMVGSISVFFNDNLFFFRLASSYDDEDNVLRINIMGELLASFNLLHLV